MIEGGESDGGRQPFRRNPCGYLGERRVCASCLTALYDIFNSV